MAVETNNQYDTLFVEAFRDVFMPHPQDSTQVICIPQGMQFKWTHNTVDKGHCGGCSAQVVQVYYVNAILGNCDDIKLPILLPLMKEWITVTRDRRSPAVCTLFDEDRRGINVDTFNPPAQRNGYRW